MVFPSSEINQPPGQFDTIIRILFQTQNQLCYLIMSLTYQSISRIIQYHIQISLKTKYRVT